MCLQIKKPYYPLTKMIWLINIQVYAKQTSCYHNPFSYLYSLTAGNILLIVEAVKTDSTLFHPLGKLLDLLQAGRLSCHLA